MFRNRANLIVFLLENIENKNKKNNLHEKYALEIQYSSYWH
jgi:hypothetical protein